MNCTCASNHIPRGPKANCVFCNIAGGLSPDTKVMFENARLMIIKDIRPASDFHYLAIPREHIENTKCLVANDRPLVEEMEAELRNVLAGDGVDTSDLSFGFHWPPFTSISHLHMHGIAPVSKMRWISRWVFKPIDMWYCSPQYALGKIKIDSLCPVHNS